MKIPPTLRPIFLPLALAFVLIASSGSFFLAKKVVAFLVLPAGIVWLCGLALLVWPGLSRRFRSILASLWLVYTLAGNPWLGAWLVRTLEHPFAESLNELRARPDLPLDAIFVLGGGTLRSPDGHPSLGLAGDRVIVAARLWREGLAEHLVASGQSVTEASGQPRLLSDDTAAIWIALGINAEAIRRLPDPVNTEEEIAAYAELIAKQAWTRVGLCTSAWHLPRALAMAEEEGLDFHPIPADFISQRLPFQPVYAIPQTKGFRRVQTALWEYLGRLAS